MYKGSINFPKSFWDIAHDLAKVRMDLRADTRSKNAEYDRGNKNFQVEVLGIMGELIMRHYCVEHNIAYEAEPIIYSGVAKKGADIVINDSQIDVKATENYLKVNEKAHLKGKGIIDHYWFIKITGNKADNYLYHYDDVDKWEVRFLGFSNAYVSEI